MIQFVLSIDYILDFKHAYVYNPTGLRPCQGLDMVDAVLPRPGQHLEIHKLVYIYTE